MIVINDYRQWGTEPAVIAMGTFDGVHIGHQTLIRKAAETAKERGYLSAVFTFDRNPMEVLKPGAGIKPIIILEKKIEKIASLGVDRCIVQPFTKEFSEMPADLFICSLIASAHARCIIVGYNFTFGRYGSGDPDTIVSAGNEYGCETIVIPPVLSEGSVVSSTAIRALLANGEREKAEKMLGYTEL